MHLEMFILVALRLKLGEVMKFKICIILCIGTLTLWAQQRIDYSKKESWAALPFNQDGADMIPKGLHPIADSLKGVDVFFVYPTNFMKGEAWNATIDDQVLNKEIEEKSMKNQASVFNASCRVYAPFYRQANIKAFYTTDTLSAIKAFGLAYQDVKDAFLYYLKYYNQGRPFIIASHSQGSLHSRMLLQEFVDGKDLAKQMVAAYIVGYPVSKNMYSTLQPCSAPEQLGCYVAWYSFKKDFIPENIHSFYKDAVCINPISWKADTISTAFSQHQGMILLNFDNKQAQKVSAQVHDNICWVDVHHPLAKGFTNFHIADYNLYWYDIRKHVADQVKLFLRQ